MKKFIRGYFNMHKSGCIVCTVQALSPSKTTIVELNLVQNDGVDEVHDDMGHDAQRTVGQDR
jgi:hypothetical protein